MSVQDTGHAIGFYDYLQSCKMYYNVAKETRYKTWYLTVDEVRRDYELWKRDRTEWIELHKKRSKK